MKIARGILFVSLVLGGIFSSARGFAQSSGAQQVTALLHEFMDAAGRGDRAVFDRFFADDVIYTRATGAVITKTDIMSSLNKTSSTPAEATTYSAEDLTVHEYGEMVIVAFRLIGRTTQKNGKVATTFYRNTGTFLRRNGRWQAVAWQATKIADGVKTER